MNREEKPGLVLTRLEDRSLEAHKAWIKGIIKGLKGDDYGSESTIMSKEDWAEAHRRFWADADRSGADDEEENSAEEPTQAD